MSQLKDIRTKVILLILIVSIVLIFASCSKGNKYIGKWYSTRRDEHFLIIKKDGTYIAGEWILPGNWTLDDDQVILTNNFGMNKIIKFKDGILTAYTSDGDELHQYYKDKKEANRNNPTLIEKKKEKEQEKKDKTKIEKFREKLPDILQNKTWINIDEDIQNVELIMENDTYIITTISKYSGTNEHKFKYKIKDVKFAPKEYPFDRENYQKAFGLKDLNNFYCLYIEAINEDNKQRNFKVVVKEDDDKYIIAGSFFEGINIFAPKEK